MKRDETFVRIEYQTFSARTPTMSSLTERKLIARKRWLLLAQILKGNDYSNIAENSVSVRRFQSYGLLSTESCPSPHLEHDDKECWFVYKCMDIPGFSMTIRHLGGNVSAERLLGFNNTGNVCVWPSEEVMTYYCMQHVQDFKDHRICELGGGMTCLAGVALAIHSEAQHVELTDGNEESVDNLKAIVDRNEFSGTSVNTRLLRWSKENPEQCLMESFDSVICADCLFFDDGREDLANLIFNILKKGGQALVFAPSRNQTFDKFSEIARKLFKVEEDDHYDKHVFSLHSKVKEELKDMYDESLHFPKLMKLIKVNSSTRDITPEAR